MVWMIGGKGTDKVSASIKIPGDRRLIQDHQLSFPNYSNYLNYISDKLHFKQNRSQVLLLNYISNNYNSRTTIKARSHFSQTTSSPVLLLQYETFATFLSITLNVCPTEIVWNCYIQLQDITFATKKQ